MPAIDFNSAATSSYKNRATIIYDEDDFDDLMENNQNLILNNPITYVKGDVKLRGGQNLTINGILVVERDLEVGASNRWGSRSGPSSITVNHATGTPAGIFSARHINFREYAGDININGLIYAGDQINITNLAADSHSFSVIGGIIGRKLTITSSWRPINITHDNNTLIEIFSATEFSPIILVEHWEEEY